MNIAMVDQSQVDAYLDRAQRFIDNVNTFKETLIERLQEIGQANPFAADVSHREVPVQTAEPMQISPVSQTTPVQMTASTPTPSPVTADDVDIDALLGDLDLDSELSL